MKNFTTITTNIATDLDEWLTKEAKREDMTKRALLEQVLRSFQFAKEREEYAASWRAMSKDKEYMKEMHMLAEAGLGDTLAQIKKYERGEY